MALPSPETKPAELGVAEYLLWQAPGAPASVKIHLDVVDAISADVIEGFNALPRRGVEVGGFLVGRREKATIFVERYERVSCEYRFGPSYILSDHDQVLFQETWDRLSGDELSIVGFYRSHTRKNLQLEQSDIEIVHRWFKDPSSVFLILKPLDVTHVMAECFFWNNGALPMQSADREIAFRGRGAGSVGASVQGLKPLVLAPRPAEPAVASSAAPSDPAPHDRHIAPKQLDAPAVPQFLRAPIDTPRERNFFVRYWEALTALLLVLCAAGLFWWQHSTDNDSDTPNPSARATAADSAPRATPAPLTDATASPVPEPVSLGLEVRPTPGEWQVTWKRDLPVIRNARRGVLFIDDGGSRKQLSLHQSQLLAGRIPYRPSSDDVSFRLEVFGQDSQSSNESFRVLLAPKPGKPHATAAVVPRPPVQKSPEKPAPETPAAEKPGPTASFPQTREYPAIPDRGPTVGQQRDQTVSQAPGRREIPDLPKPTVTPAPPRLVPAQVVTRVRPEVTEGIRSRITREVVVMVKVTIDASGRVTHAVPVTRGDGLTTYLARRASEAALKWRFQPARENDRPVSSSQVIRFVFEK